MSDEPNEPLNDPLTDHDYDGIKEFDNPLPTWWLATFLLTIIFSSLYYLHYEIAMGPTLQDELRDSLKVLEDLARKNAPVQTETEDQLAVIMADPRLVAEGSKVFADKCAVCHGPQLGGLIGPNLTDNFWIHGKGTRLDVSGIIRDGVADKGMPPWGPLLSKNEIYGATAFVLSKKGSQPPNAKAPQGNPVE